jgi:hypothetical protein
LGPAFANNLAPVITAVVQKFDPLTDTILTDQGRNEASAKFLNCCRLLVHHNPNIVLTDTQQGQPLSTKANIFPHEPTAHFCRNMLGPLSAGQTGYIPNFYNYVEALMSWRGIMESAYLKTYFTPDRVRALFLVESWAMSPQTRDLAHLPAKTLHIYGFLQCLNKYQWHANLLPAKGIMFLQAKKLSYMAP